MLIRRTAVLVVVLTVIAVAISFAIRRRDLTIISSVLLVYEALVAVAVLLWFAIAESIWRMLKSRLSPVDSSARRRLYVTVLTCLVVAVVVGWFANRRWLPGKLHASSLIFDGFLVAWTVLLGRSLHVRTRQSTILLVSAAVLVAMITLVLVNVAPPSPERRDRNGLQNLTTLPYVTWVPAGDDPDKTGVTLYDEERAFAGLNIFNSRDFPRSSLVDMSGNVLHEWSTDVYEDAGWMHVELMPNGDLWAIAYERALLKLDWDSNLLWKDELPAHHDIAVTPEGEVYVLTRHEGIRTFLGLPLPIVDDRIVVISPDHEVTKQISIHDILRRHVPSDRLFGIYKWLIRPTHTVAVVRAVRTPGSRFNAPDELDLYHSNTIEMIDRDIDDVFRSGNLLYCARNINLVAVIDPDAEEVLWTFGPGQLERPHQPTLLDNGHVLIFDNGYHRGYSRVLELDPATKEIAWQYIADPPQHFFSPTRGGNQRLPNGNTLITNSDHGMAFEVTPEGETVWEFYNPIMKGKSRAAMYRLVRITEAERYPCLGRLRDAKRNP